MRESRPMPKGREETGLADDDKSGLIPYNYPIDGRGDGRDLPGGRQVQGMHRIARECQRRSSGRRDGRAFWFPKASANH